MGDAPNIEVQGVDRTIIFPGYWGTRLQGTVNSIQSLHSPGLLLPVSSFCLTCSTVTDWPQEAIRNTFIHTCGADDCRHFRWCRQGRQIIGYKIDLIIPFEKLEISDYHNCLYENVLRENYFMFKMSKHHILSGVQYLYNRVQGKVCIRQVETKSVCEPNHRVAKGFLK